MGIQSQNFFKSLEVFSFSILPRSRKKARALLEVAWFAIEFWSITGSCIACALCTIPALLRLPWHCLHHGFATGRLCCCVSFIRLPRLSDLRLATRRVIRPSRSHQLPCRPSLDRITFRSKRAFQEPTFETRAPSLALLLAQELQLQLLKVHAPLLCFGKFWPERLIPHWLLLLSGLILKGFCGRSLGEIILNFRLNIYLLRLPLLISWFTLSLLINLEPLLWFMGCTDALPCLSRKEVGHADAMLDLWLSRCLSLYACICSVIDANWRLLWCLLLCERWFSFSHC